MFERAKTFHALYHAVTVIGVYMNGRSEIWYQFPFASICWPIQGCVKFSFVRHLEKSVVAQHHTQVRLQLSGSKQIVVGFGL
jgi:hypothetical protein